MTDFDSTDMAEAMGLNDWRQAADANVELEFRLTAILHKLATSGGLTRDELRLLAYACGIKTKDIR